MPPPSPLGEATATVMGFPAETVTAVGTILLTLATIALAVPTIFLALAAWRQLPLLVTQIKDAQSATKDEAERDRAARKAEEWRHIEANTLRACERYFSNPVIVAASKKVFEASENGTKYSKEKFGLAEHDLLTVLNFLNGLGVGVEEGIFSGDIIKDHMPNTVVKVVDTIIPALIDQPAKFQALMNLRDNWKKASPSYQRRPAN
jgi:hypothetical protein